MRHCNILVARRQTFIFLEISPVSQIAQLFDYTAVAMVIMQSNSGVHGEIHQNEIVQSDS